MNDESTSEERTVHDEKPSGGASGAGKVSWENICFAFSISNASLLFLQLESMSKEELIKLVKNQILLKKKLETKITELSNANTSLCQSEEVRRRSIPLWSSACPSRLANTQSNRWRPIKIRRLAARGWSTKDPTVETSTRTRCQS